MHTANMSTDFATAVHAALRLRAADPSAGNPLADLALVHRAAGDGNLRRAINQVLQAALQRWQPTTVMTQRCCGQDFSMKHRLPRLPKPCNMAEVTIYKVQRRAIERLAAVIFAMEQRAVTDSCWLRHRPGSCVLMKP